MLGQLTDGPVDVVGDVHGEIDALRALLSVLGYSPAGRSATGRSLVFLGDLVDRGPDSPAVVSLVAELVARGRALCVMGNHELNLLRGLKKEGSAWFHGEKTEVLRREVRPGVLEEVAVGQTPMAATEREACLRFFASLPMALERQDLRVVHACWAQSAVETVRAERDALALFRRHDEAINQELDGNGITDHTDRELARQIKNPVKVLLGGLERRRREKAFVGGKWRMLERVPWWDDYRDPQLCVFGHYWRLPIPGQTMPEKTFDQMPLGRTLGRGNAMCIDYSVGGRWSERSLAGFSGTFKTRLAALRWPERELVWDDGSKAVLER